jgi:NADH-quinone oxidoreductase subunit J
MDGEIVKWVFYFFCGMTVFSGLMVVTQNHPVRSVLFLVFTFFTSAVLWIILQAEFLSLILLLVYVGAVMTLFLFVVMMLHVDIEAMRSHLLRLLPLGCLIVGGLLTVFIYAWTHSVLPKQIKTFNQHLAVSKIGQELVISTAPQTSQASNNTEAIGLVLYTDYVYPFEIAAVILLVAMIAAITLTHIEQ